MQLKGYKIYLTREPGGNKISEQIRNIILNKYNIKMDLWTETLLYIAARRQHIVENILPELKKKKIVICDRFIDSTLVYQGYVNGLEIKILNKIQSIVLDILKPDLTFFFDIEPSIAYERLKIRNKIKMNRIDLKKKIFHNKVYKSYKILFNKNSNRIKIINARKTVSEILKQVYFFIEERIKKINNK